MSGYECEKCMDTGYVLVRQDGYDISVKCECYEKLMYQRRLRRSGISEEMQKKVLRILTAMGSMCSNRQKQPPSDITEGF